MCVTIQGQTATSHQPFHPGLCVSLSRCRLPPVINHSTLAYVCSYPGADCHQPFHPGLILLLSSTDGPRRGRQMFIKNFKNSKRTGSTVQDTVQEESCNSFQNKISNKGEQARHPDGDFEAKIPPAAIFLGWLSFRNIR